MPARLRPAVFLDRDGVLNEVSVREGTPRPPTSIADLTLLPGVQESCDRLRQLGYLLVVVTNQPDIARGTVDCAMVDAINESLKSQLTLDSIWVCPHDDADGCACRKPLPGLLHRAAEYHGIDLTRSYMVGDRWRDIEAGRAAGCRTAWVVNPAYEERPAEGADVLVNSLSEATRWIAASAVCPQEEHDID